MGIKRGVSLYCYQQEEFFHRMTWRDELREVATNLGGADGIEIVSECTIPNYPMPPESFFYEWNNEMARWGLKAVTMDVYFDPLQFVDHVMNYDEAAEHIKYDLRLAKKMGFENIRLTGRVHEVIAKALPLAEELDVRMTMEIHWPNRITPGPGLRGGLEDSVARDIAFIQKTGTKHYGLQPDMGIFQKQPSKVQVTYTLRDFIPADEADALYDTLMQIRAEEGPEAMHAYFEKNYPQIYHGSMFAATMIGTEPTAKPEELYSIAPYIYCCHGKFYEMTEIPGKPGQYEEVNFLYPEAIEVLKACGYEGYINSEYEGQRSQQDRGDAYLANEVEEVRRHHEMLKRLIGA